MSIWSTPYGKSMLPVWSTPYFIFYISLWSTPWGNILLRLWSSLIMFIFKNSILPFFSLFFCLFEELHMSFSLHYNGVLHEVKFVIGHGVLKTWCHGRTPYLTFLHSYGVLHKIYFFKGCEVLKTGFCFKEHHMLYIFHCNGVLHKVNF